jgi:hypothetical protein
MPHRPNLGSVFQRLPELEWEGGLALYTLTQTVSRYFISRAINLQTRWLLDGFAMLGAIFMLADRLLG